MTSPIVSPYSGLATKDWAAKTQELISAHPLSTTDLSKAVHDAWQDIFNSRIGAVSAKIGEDIFFVPQVMATLLQELVAMHLQKKFPTEWRRDRAKSEKDLVYLPDQQYSIEVKTSSSPNDIYGNRSYAQPSTSSGKSKSGYYLAVNFDAFHKDVASDTFFSVTTHPVYIRKVRFGWLDHSDWRAQAAATGQQASLTVDAKKFKLITI